MKFTVNLVKDRLRVIQRDAGLKLDLFSNDLCVKGFAGVGVSDLSIVRVTEKQK